MDAAWPIIVQHASVVSDTALVCRLLCVSKVVHCAIEGHCAGRLEVVYLLYKGVGSVAAADYDYPSDKLDSFVLWLAKHGNLVDSLWLTGTDESEAGQATAESAIALALEQAGQLRLRHIKCRLSSPLTTGLLLQHLPGQTLTSLDINIQDTSNSSVMSQLAVKALSHLTNLSSMSLTSAYDAPSESSGVLNSWVAATGSLLQLTSLTAHRISSPAALRQTPPCLRELVLKDGSGDDGLVVFSTNFNLAHLTNLTKLHVESALSISRATILPPNVQELVAWDCGSTQALLPLAACLQRLTLRNNTVTAEHLLELHSSLTALTDLQLDYYCSDVQANLRAAAAARAWSILTALRGVHMGGQILAPGQLLQLKGLTYLSLCTPWVSVEGTIELVAPAVLAEVLRLSPQLQKLRLADCWRQDGRAGIEAVADLNSVIAGLQQLRSLSIEGRGHTDDDGELAAHQPDASAGLCALAPATQITALRLAAMVPSSLALMHLLCSLTGLLALDLECVGNMRDEHLAAIAVVLTRLTELKLQDVDVGDEGAHELSGLTRLSHVSVEITGITRDGWRKAMRLA